MKESLKRGQRQIEHMPQVYSYASINKKKYIYIFLSLEK
jgi:hypothetical protein